jgi:hypothetical protein
MPDLLVARYLAPFVGNDGAAQLLRRAMAVTLTQMERQRLGDVTGSVLLWTGARSAEDDLVARVGRWRRIFPLAALIPVTVQQGGALVAEDAPAALRSTLQAWVA